jgi:hypothetical protein
VTTISRWIAMYMTETIEAKPRISEDRGRIDD